MMAEGMNDLEADFRRRDESLSCFYAAEAVELSDAERASLTPILNSLRGHSTRYEALEVIGAGAEKQITLVLDYQLDRRVALARSVREETAEEQERFLREARLTANLSHPNILPIYDIGLDDEGRAFFTMELIPGDSLGTILRKLREGDELYCAQYPPEKLLNLYLKICDAIAYAHSRDVLHLDIKPDNIRVGKFGEVLVCDWGLARIVTRSAESSHLEMDALDGDVLNDMTLSGTMKGTPGFMAPEQTMAYSEKSEQTDIYSLGAVLYKLLTLELPVRGQSANEVIQNTREGHVIPPRKRRPDRPVPASLAAVMMKALALKPEDRYESVEALQQEIIRYLAGRPTQAEKAGAFITLSLLLQRHSRIGFLLFFFIICLAVIVTIYSVAVGREKREALAARDRAERHNALFMEQQKSIQRLGKELGEAVEFAAKSRDFMDAQTMIELLEVGLAEDPPPEKRRELLIQRGTLHFVLQQFSAATECFDQAGGGTEELRSWSRTLSELKPRDHTLLSDRQLADLLVEVTSESLKAPLFYMYYHHVRRQPNPDPQEHIYLVSVMLDRLNGIRRSPSQFVLPSRFEALDDGRFQLDLSRLPYEVYTLEFVGLYRKSILQPLRLSSLDLSYTEVRNLSDFDELGLKELRLAGVELPPFSTLLQEVEGLGLEKMVISRDVLDETQLKRLRIVCEVEEVGAP
jgi:serine/threonine protein kinase